MFSHLLSLIACMPPDWGLRIHSGLNRLNTRIHFDKASVQRPELFEQALGACYTRLISRNPTEYDYKLLRAFRQANCMFRAQL